MRCCLITYSDIFFRKALLKFEESKKQYCSKYDLDFIYEPFSTSETEKPSWYKIKLLKDYLYRYDYIIITDYDSYVCNQNYNVYDLIDQSCNADLICNTIQEKNFFLLGCSMFKSTTKVYKMIDYFMQNKPKNDKEFLAEEKFFNDNINEFDIKIHVDNNINCIYNIHESSNPFILHYAGITNPMRIKQIHDKRCNIA